MSRATENDLRPVGLARVADRPSRRRRRAARTIGIGLLCAPLLAAPPISAQEASSIVMDGLLDGVQAEALAGPDYEIPASKGVQSGSNLFFSYTRFGLERGESATFTGPPSVATVLNRVTGSEISSINGLLRSEIPGASVYLLNPNGVVIGEDASLDLSGAFHATTADYLEFGDGGEFHARFPERDSPLSMDPVSAFGFLSENPSDILLDGAQLLSANIRFGLVATGHAFSLIGGDIAIGGGSDPGQPAYVFTGGERLDLASLDSPGVVRIVNADPGDPASSPSLEVDPQPGQTLRYGNVRIADGATLITGGPPIDRAFASTFVDGSGDVHIRAHDLTLDDAVIRTVTTTDRPAGRVEIDLTGDFVADGRGLNRPVGVVAGSGFVIQRQDASVPEAFSTSLSGSQFGVQGGEITTRFDADSNPIQIEHRGVGAGGSIRIEAENVALLGGAKLSSSGLFGGDGGTITVAGQDTVMLAGSRDDGSEGGIFANALEGANSGSIDVDARRLVIDERAGIFSEVSNDEEGNGGAGGLIDVDVDQLLIEGSGRIDTTTRGSGPGGKIEIDASEWVRLSGRTDDFFFSSVTTFSLEEGTGPAGTIEIRTPELRLADGAGISTSAFEEGAGGVIDLRADVIELARSSIASSAELGEAGDIYINGGPLEPGSLEIDKPGGVSPGELLFLDRSTISTNANDGSGQGGNIVIDPEYVVLRESAITARAVRGQGGNIVIVADQVITDLDSTIDAISQFNTNGTVEITTSGQDLRGDFTTLPETIPDVVELLRERCAARRSGAASASFVLRGRDGLPPSPEDDLPAFHEIEPASGGEAPTATIEDPIAPIVLVLGCDVTPD